MQQVINWASYDHIVFIIVLLAAFSFYSFKRVLGLVGIFLLGHTLAMFLSAYQAISISSRWLGLLIVITILITVIFNLRTLKKKERQRKMGLLYFIAAFFGLIQGMGLYSFFNRLGDSVFLPLLEFSLGIGAAYLLVAFVVLFCSFIFQNLFRVNRRDWIIVVSAISIGIILPILRENIQKFL